jgi:hypothetical protein
MSGKRKPADFPPPEFFELEFGDPYLLTPTVQQFRLWESFKSIGFDATCVRFRRSPRNVLCALWRVSSYTVVVPPKRWRPFFALCQIESYVNGSNALMRSVWR